MGDLNSDPVDGASIKSAIQSLLANPRVNATYAPSSAGGAEAARQGGMNTSQTGDPRLDTADFNDRGVGNLRVDYVLPAAELSVAAAGVFWPPPGAPLAEAAATASAHRLVWVDLALP